MTTPDSDKIGTSSSSSRKTLGITIGGVVVLGGLIAGYNVYSHKQDAAQSQELDAFRAKYATQCKADAFSGPTDPAVKQAYLDSPHLESVITAQLSALDHGAKCDDVAQALRAAEFPMPKTM